MSKQDPKSEQGDARGGNGAPETSTEIERLRRQMRRLTERHEDALAEIDRLNKKLARAEETLSFQLGYALIHSAKSIDAALSLPATLWGLRKEAGRRKGRPDAAPGVPTKVAAVVEVTARGLVSKAGKALKRPPPTDPSR